MYAGIVPIKLLYFEAGSKCSELGEKYRWIVWQVFDHQMVVFHPILRILA